MPKRTPGSEKVGLHDYPTFSILWKTSLQSSASSAYSICSSSAYGQQGIGWLQRRFSSKKGRSLRANPLHHPILRCVFLKGAAGVAAAAGLLNGCITPQAGAPAQTEAGGQQHLGAGRRRLGDQGIGDGAQ